MGRVEGFLVRRLVADEALLAALRAALGTREVAFYEDERAAKESVLVERRARPSGFVLDVSLYRVPDEAPHGLAIARGVAEGLGEEVVVSPPPTLAGEMDWVWIVPGAPAVLVPEDPRDDAVEIVPASARPLPPRWRGLAN